MKFFLSSHYSEHEPTDYTYTRVTGRHYVSVDGQHWNETADWRCKPGISWLITDSETQRRSLCHQLLEIVKLERALLLETHTPAFRFLHPCQGADTDCEFSKFLWGYSHRISEILTIFTLQVIRSCRRVPLDVKFEQYGFPCLINRAYVLVTQITCFWFLLFSPLALQPNSGLGPLHNTFSFTLVTSKI
jgi:hypothetical protein